MTDIDRQRAFGPGAALRCLWSHPGTFMIVGGVLGVAVWRLVAGTWHLTDLLTPLIVIAVFPSVAWLLHRRQPRTDPPRNPSTFLPWQTLILVLAGSHLLVLVAFPGIGHGPRFALAVALAGIAYEWTNHLIRTDRPISGSTDRSDGSGAGPLPGARCAASS